MSRRLVCGCSFVNHSSFAIIAGVIAVQMAYPVAQAQPVDGDLCEYLEKEQVAFDKMLGITLAYNILPFADRDPYSAKNSGFTQTYFGSSGLPIPVDAASQWEKGFGPLLAKVRGDTELQRLLRELEAAEEEHLAAARSEFAAHQAARGSQADTAYAKAKQRLRVAEETLARAKRAAMEHPLYVLHLYLQEKWSLFRRWNEHVRSQGGVSADYFSYYLWQIESELDYLDKKIQRILCEQPPDAVPQEPAEPKPLVKLPERSRSHPIRPVLQPTFAFPLDQTGGDRALVPLGVAGPLDNPFVPPKYPAPPSNAKWDLIRLNPQPEPPSFDTDDLVGLHPRREDPGRTLIGDPFRSPKGEVGLTSRPGDPGFWGFVGAVAQTPMGNRPDLFHRFHVWSDAADPRMQLHVGDRATSITAVIEALYFQGQVGNDLSWLPLAQEGLSHALAARGGQSYHARVQAEANALLRGVLAEQLVRLNDFGAVPVERLATPAPAAAQAGSQFAKVKAQSSTGSPVPGATFTFVVQSPAPDGGSGQTTHSATADLAGEVTIVQGAEPPQPQQPGELQIPAGASVVGLISGGGASEGFHTAQSMTDTQEAVVVHVESLPAFTVTFAVRQASDPAEQQGVMQKLANLLRQQLKAEDEARKTALAVLVEALRKAQQEDERRKSSWQQIIEALHRDYEENQSRSASGLKALVEAMRRAVERNPDATPDMIQEVLELVRRQSDQRETMTNNVSTRRESTPAEKEAMREQLEAIARIAKRRIAAESAAEKEAMQQQLEATVRIVRRAMAAQAAADESSSEGRTYITIPIPRLTDANGEPVNRDAVAEAVRSIVEQGEALYGEVAVSRQAEALSPAEPYFLSRGSWGQRHSDQWALHRVGLIPQDPDSEETKSGWLPKLDANRHALAPVVVAVIGSGVDYSHPELMSQMWVNRGELINGMDDDGNGLVDDVFGWNYRDNSSDVMDYGGHDTHVAGVIAAEWNGYGIAGVNPAARIMAVKVADRFGQTDSAAIGNAIFYAVNHGARVINISYSGEQPSRLEQDAIHYAGQRGVLVVGAAGNQAGDTALRAIASYDGVLTVAATSVEGDRAEFSNWGQAIEIAAPGLDILGPRARGTDFLAYVGDNEDYQPGSAVVGKEKDLYRAGGTSFAAPIVAGAASYLWSLQPYLSLDQVRRKLLMSADDIDVTGWDQNSGAGLLNVRKAVAADPDSFLHARIIQVAPGRDDDGKPTINVQGVAAGNQLTGVWLQVGFGEDPANDAWKTVRYTTDPVSGLVGSVPASTFDQRGNWTIRLLVQDKGKLVRQSRARLNLE